MTPIALGFGGPYDIAIIAAVVVLLFGGSKIVDFAKNAGLGIKELKKAARDDDQPSPSVATPEPVKAVDTAKPAGD